jgi:hypothetical protein
MFATGLIRDRRERQKRQQFQHRVLQKQRTAEHPQQHLATSASPNLHTVPLQPQSKLPLSH